MITSEFVNVAGRKQQILRGGSGPTLVWLHGVNMVNAEDPVLQELSKTHSVIAPIAPGYNDLAEISQLQTVHDLALAYDDLFDTLGLKGVAVAGHSFGGMVAAELAAHVPDRVGRLVLLSPLGLWNDDYPVADLFAVPYPDMQDLLWRGAKTPRAQSNSDAQQNVEELVALAQSLTTVTQYIWSIPDKGLRRRLYRIKAPTLVVFGANDAFVSPRYAKDFTSGLRAGQSQIIADASHMAPYENPAVTASIINKFLAEKRA